MPRGSHDRSESNQDLIEHAHEVADSSVVDECDAPADPTDKSACEWNHEPFRTFQTKVVQLATETFAVKPANVKALRMNGGSYNRVIGVIINTQSRVERTADCIAAFLRHIIVRLPPFPPHPSKQQGYVIRIPRLENSAYGIDYDVAVLHFARSKLGALVPNVPSFDSSEDNVLGKRYMIQERRPGVCLNRILKMLDVTQYASLTRQVLAFHKQMHAITSPAPGIIHPSTSAVDTQLEAQHIPMRRVRNDSDPIPFVRPQPQSTLEHLLDLCSRWEAHQEGSWVNPIWAQFKKIAQHLHTRGFIPDTDQFHFMHLDMFARNLLITPASSKTVTLSGVVDWDAEYSSFVPKFMAFRAPFWLWTGDIPNAGPDVVSGPVVEQEILTCSTTANIDKAAKAIWDQEAGEEWKRFATAPEYIIARRMWTLLRFGHRNSDCFAEGENIVKAWEELHPEDDVEEEFDFTEEELAGMDSGSDSENEAEDDAFGSENEAFSALG
jgi:hypothetical protein